MTHSRDPHNNEPEHLYPYEDLVHLFPDVPGIGFFSISSPPFPFDSTLLPPQGEPTHTLLLINDSPSRGLDPDPTIALPEPPKAVPPPYFPDIVASHYLPETTTIDSHSRFDASPSGSDHVIDAIDLVETEPSSSETPPTSVPTPSTSWHNTLEGLEYNLQSNPPLMSPFLADSPSEKITPSVQEKYPDDCIRLNDLNEQLRNPSLHPEIRKKIREQIRLINNKFSAFTSREKTRKAREALIERCQQLEYDFDLLSSRHAVVIEENETLRRMIADQQETISQLRRANHSDSARSSNESDGTYNSPKRHCR